MPFMHPTHIRTSKFLRSRRTMTQPIQETCFFSLPREIRDLVYKEAFSASPLIFPLIRRKRQRFGDLNTPLLRTNKQICSEASSVLYSSTCFHIGHPEQFIRWLNTIGDHNVKRLKNLALVVESEYEVIPEPASSTAHIPRAIALSRSTCSQLRQILTRWTDKVTVPAAPPASLSGGPITFCTFPTSSEIHPT